MNSLASIYLVVIGITAIIAQINYEKYAISLTAGAAVVVGFLLTGFDQVRKHRLSAWVEKQKAERDEWAERQRVERAEWVEWAKVRGPDLEADINDLKAKLAKAIDEREKIWSQIEERQVKGMELLISLQKTMAEKLS